VVRIMEVSNQTPTADDARIGLSEDYEVHYWTARLNCTSRQLRQAVQAAGTRVGDVKAWLREHDE
jgi:hypothetical protein